MWMPYLPAGSGCPCTLAGELSDSTVFSLAPARQTESYGTSLPHTSRPLMPGLSYVIPISVRPTV